VAIPLPGPDRLPVGPLRDFVVALHELYDQAGQPAARLISLDTFNLPRRLESVSHQTISSTLQGNAVPGWGKVRSIVISLAGRSDMDLNDHEIDRRFKSLWVKARTALQTRGEPGPPAPSNRPLAPEISPASSPSAIRTGEILRPRIEVTPASDSPPIKGGLPHLDVAFTGREALLHDMRTGMRNNPRTPLVLHGVSGAGKTELAREYVERHADEYPVTWWIEADDLERVGRSMVELAARLGVREDLSVEQIVDAVIGRLESRQEPFLLVFDAVDDEDVRRLVPTAFAGDVIVTTRSPTWGNDSTTMGVEVADLSVDEAVTYLCRCDTSLTQDQAQDLVGRIGRLPLALAHAASLRHTSGLPWDDVLRQLYSAADPTLNRISAAVEDALRTFGHANPAAMLLLELFAWFDSEPVPLDVLRRGHTGDVSPALRRALRNPVDLPKALHAIQELGLARLYADQRVEVYPVTRRALRDALSPAALDRGRRNTHEILAASGRVLPEDDASERVHDEIAPHVLAADLIGSSSGAALATVHHQVRYWYVVGDYAAACSLAEAAVAAWEADPAIGPADELVLRTMREWANGLRARGEYRRARELTAEGMARLRNDPEYGHDHELTLSMSSSHASDLRIAGDYQRALEIDQDTLSRSVRQYRDAHPLTATRRHNLAVSLRHVGDFAAAESADRVTLEYHCKQYGPEDRRTLLSANAVAEDLYGLGRYSEVIDLRTEYGQTRRGRPGKPDRAVVLFRRTVALALRSGGNVTEALDVLGEHYRECAATLGHDHEYTLAALVSYANTLRLHGEATQAHEHCRRAVAAYAETFGSDNPLTLAAQVNLASILRATGERTTTRPMDEAASEVFRSRLSERHPFTIAALANLATDYALQGQHSSAKALSEHAYALAGRVRGGEHPDTLAIAANLVLDRVAVGELAAASTLREALSPLLRGHGLITAEVSHGRRVDCTIEPPST
jgi:tetratricopeptide (TPR) repeat protein